MKSLKDTIDESLENFSAPIAQGFQNAKDSVSDLIEDATYAANDKIAKSNPEKKGSCLGCLGWFFIICILFAMCSNDDSLETSDFPSSNTTQIESVATENPSSNNSSNISNTASQVPFTNAQLVYAVENNVELNQFTQEEAALYNWLINYEGELIALQTDNIFGANRYTRTQDSAYYLYYGETKDNRPHGYGILLKAAKNYSGLINYSGCAYDLVYIGEFKEGRLDGFGYQFCNSKYGYEILDWLCPYEADTDEYIYYYLIWANYVEYFGEFSDGAPCGLGNQFHFVTAESEYIDMDTVDLDATDYLICVGEFSSGQVNGACKYYAGGYLWYDGEMKDDQFHGYGKLYLVLSDVLEYEGEFRNDMRHGTGTSYNEYGEIEYSGEWVNGDYA